MSGAWRVDPAEVDAVVSRMAGPVVDVLECRNAVGAALGAAATSVGSDQVAAAVDAFGTHLEELLAGVSSTLASARTVVTTTTGVYVEAGADIAARTDRGAPAPERFSGRLGRTAVIAR